MKYVAALLLAQLGGNESPKEADIEHILKACGTEVDDERVKELLEKVGEKPVQEVLADGRQKLAEKVVVVAAEAAPAAESAAAEETKEEAKEEEKKEEKKEEEEEEEMDMGGLFDF